MDSVANPAAKLASSTKNTVRAEELLALLDSYLSKIKVLSLDCFDTLIWRKSATPIDVFFDMQQRPAFKSLGFTARLRSQAEVSAREAMFLNNGMTEVKLKDIYLACYPTLTQEQIIGLENDELAAERNACYAFPPVLELIRKAHSHGLKVVLVSDTYLDQKQLRHLLENTLPKDVLPMISDIFCSSEAGQAKSSGLFNQVLAKLNTSPSTILHIGDHSQADYLSPLNAGLHAAHLIHHDKHIAALLRMQALAAGFIDPTIRYSRPLSSAFRGMLAASQLAENKPETTIGYSSVGQIIYAFSRFICDEVELLEREGKRPKVLFLLRDAYLPSLVCEAIKGKSIGHSVNISRFAAVAAAFRTKQDVDRYLSANILSFRFHDICKQLLIPDAMTLQILQLIVKAHNPATEFIKQIQKPETLEAIFKSSAAYRERLIRYLQKEVGLEKGDTLVFVDLGYTGSAQLKLEPIFKEEMDINIVGRYLISLRIPNWESSRRGLFDPSSYDDRILYMMVAYIALLEQICTSNGKSVIDYDEQGNPIFSDTSVNQAQIARAKTIQDECIRFAKAAEKFFSASQTSLSSTVLRDTAMAELSRLLFLPSKSELEYMKAFEFDLNLGTKDLINVFDQEKGLMGLRRRGLFFMERNLKTMRTNYPAELRTAGLELVMLLMAQHRCEFDLRQTDLSLRREAINVIAIRGGKSSQNIIEAFPTYDGYFSLTIPIGSHDFQIGIQFGLHYKWIQLESADVMSTSSLMTSAESQHTEEASQNLAIDQMIDRGGGLFECLSQTGLMVFIPSPRGSKEHFVLRIVFRPLATWEKENQKPIRV